MLPVAHTSPFYRHLQAIADPFARFLHLQPSSPAMNNTIHRFQITAVLPAGLILILLACPLLSLRADTLTWSGGNSTDWSDSANWGGTVPKANDWAYFNSSPSNQPTLTGNISIEGVRFGTSAGNITLSGGTLSLGIGGLYDGGTVTRPTVTNASATLTAVNTTVAAQLSSMLANGQTGLTVTGSGIPAGAVVTGATVNSGFSDSTLTLNASATATSNNNIYTLPNGSSSTLTILSNIALTANQSWQLNSGGVTSVNGSLSGSSDLVIAASNQTNNTTLPNLRLYGTNSGMTGTIWIGQSTGTGSLGLLLGSASAMTNGLIYMSDSDKNLWLTGGAENVYTFGINGTETTGARVAFRVGGSSSGGLYATGGDVYWNPGGGTDYNWSGTAAQAVGMQFGGSNDSTPRMFYLGNSQGNLTITGANKSFIQSSGGNNPGRVTLLSALGGNGSTARTLSSNLPLLVLTRPSVVGTGAGGSGSLTLNITSGATSISDMNQLPGGNLIISGGVLVLDGISGSTFASSRGFGTGAGQWQFTGGGFASRNGSLTIPNGTTGFTTSTYDGNRTFGTAVLANDGSFYANGNLNVGVDTTLSAARTWIIAATGQGLSSNSTRPVYTFSGNLSGAGSLLVQGGANSANAPELVLSGRNAWTSGATFQLNSSGPVYMNVGSGGLIASKAIVRFDGDESLPTGNGGNLAYISGQNRNDSTPTGILLTGNATGKVYDPSAGYKFLLGTTDPSGTSDMVFGADQGKSQIQSAQLLLNTQVSGTMTTALLARSGAELTLGAAGAAFQIVPTFGNSTTANSTTATVVSDLVTGNRTLIKRGEGTMVLGNVGYTSQDGLTDKSSLISWRIGRGTANAVSSPYSDGAIRETGSASTNSLTGFNINLAGGVLESNGSFIRALGTGSTQVQWSANGGGGFSAYGGNLTVNLGSSLAQVSWNTSPFVRENNPLMFGSETANATVDFQNPIALGSAQREIRVYDNATSDTDLALLSGNLSGTGAVLKTGNGTLQLGSTNAYSGNTTISAGTLKITSIANGGAVSSLGNSTNAAANLNFSGGTLEYAGASNGATDRNFTITAGTGAAIAVTGAGELTISGASASTNGSLTKSGSGVLNLGGTNLHSGGTSITQGTLALSGGNALGDASTVTLSNASGVVLALNSSETIGSLRGGGSTGGTTQIAAGQTLTVAESGNATYAGQITGSGGFTKSGAGTLTFSSTSTGSHGGSTSVAAGTLVVDGNFSAATGPVSITSGATLSGSGSLGGATTLNSGTILAPGNSPGILTFGSSLALNAGSDIRMEINGSSRGTTYDAIDVTGALTYGGNLQLTFGQTFGTGNHPFNLWSFGSQSGSFDSITLAGAYTGSLTNDSGTWTLTEGLNSFEFSQATGSLVLTVAVPEPGTWALLGVAAGTFLLWRRRTS